MVDLSKLWPHQIQTFEFGKDKQSIFDASSAGCVDCETEFLTPTGWKRIDQYKQGDLVAQFHPTTLEIDFTAPIDYITKLSGPMYHFAPARGLDMLLSANHRVLNYTNNTVSLAHASTGWRVLAAKDFAALSVKRKIPSAFVYKPITQLDLTDAQLQVMVAVIADGHFPSKLNTCIMRLKKERKKERIRLLLSAANIQYKERVCNGKIKGFTVFSFTAPFRDKIYDEKYWSCSAEQLELIADEALYWDGNCKDSFFTTIKASADFIQFAVSSTGAPAGITTCVRNNENSNRIRPTEYVVHYRKKETYFVGGMRPESISMLRPKDGKQYCFTTKTSFWLARRNGRIFATGNSGKSFAHASLAEDFLERRNGSRVLIVAPKTLVRSAWNQEFSTHMPDIQLALAEAPEDNRKKAFESKSDIIVMNVDGLSWLAHQPERWLKARLGSKPMLICDESHTLKNPQAMRTKAALKIASHFHTRHCMTGTPAPNSIVELWSQMKLIDGGQRLGSRYTAFRNLMQQPVNNGPFTKWVDKPQAADIVYGLIGDILIRHSFDEVMKHVPNMEHRVIYFDLDPKHRKLYDRLEKEARLEHEGKSISAVNAASLAGKLLQCASGASYTEDSNAKEKNWAIFDKTRYELIADLVEARAHTLVFISWTHQKKCLEDELKHRGLSYAIIDGSVKSTLERQKAIDDMQAGNLRCILIHPNSGAHGITLTRATTTIFASPLYQADLYQQGTARIRRGMQDKPTESIIVLAKGTRDEQAYEVFTGKRDRMDALNNLFEQKN